MYNIKISLDLVSSIKNKLYQLLLFIKSVEFNNEEYLKYEIRYKTIGSLDNISLNGQNSVALNHHMMIPVLL